MRPLGAVPAGDGLVEFRVWAPRADKIEVELAGKRHALDDEGSGIHSIRLDANVGDDYVYLLDGDVVLPDPCSRFQPEGVRGPSRIIDPGAFEWSDEGWPGITLDELVIYELHVATFTQDGTFESIIPELRSLGELGVTAIELMPVATFPGNRNWGYDGLYLYAPHPVYGGPEGLARLVDAAHGEGIAVFLDVVYNHVGPGSETLAAFGPYFTDRYGTFWGEAINFDGPGSDPVREWAIQNACMWVSDYHIDGLRLDAIHAIYDFGATHILEELGERVRRATDRSVLLIAESGLNDPRVIRSTERGGLGLDGQWADDFHHALHALLTGERDGYYVDFGCVEHLAKAFRRPFVYDGQYSEFRHRRHGRPAFDRRPEQFVVFSQNHDQVGNRALGDRPSRETRRLAAFCTLLSPFIPLLFMGEEYGEETPFLFFTDHIDPAIAEATRKGRRREFARFEGFAGELPDPQSHSTFERSRLTRETADEDLVDFYASLLEFRRELPTAEAHVSFDEDERWLAVVRGEYQLLCNFNDTERRIPTTKQTVALATDSVAIESSAARLPAWSGAVLQ